MRASAFKRGSARRDALAVLAVAALHAALLLALRGPGKPPTSAAEPPRVQVRLIPLPAPVPARPPEPLAMPLAAAERRSTPPRASPAAPARRAEPFTARSTPPAPVTPAPINPAAPEVQAAAPPASAPEQQAPKAPGLLDTEASRRAIRAAARATTLNAELARSREEPERATTQQRLAESVRSAGKGDCLKGDYPGAGMGLLSLPFLAAAAATGNCAK